MEFSSRELSSSIENIRERGLSVVETARSRGVGFVDRTQRVTSEWLAENERKLLHGVLDALRELEARIERRLELLSHLTVDAAGEVEEEDAGEVSEPTAGLPIEDYDQYTAKEIVAELSALSADAARAILEYEKAHKARATVIRAAEQKLVA